MAQTDLDCNEPTMKTCMHASKKRATARCLQLAVYACAKCSKNSCGVHIVRAKGRFCAACSGEMNFLRPIGQLVRRPTRRFFAEPFAAPTLSIN